MSLPDDSARKSRCESISSIRHPLGCARANTRTLPHQPASAIRTQLSPACSVLACDMCASRFTTLMSAPLGPMGISRSTSSCALSRRYRRYSTVPPSTSSWRSHGISMVSRSVSRSVSRWYLDVLMALSPWLRLLRPPVAVHAEMAPSTATRLGSFIQGGDAILVSTQNCTRLLRLSPPPYPKPIFLCAHSPPQPVPVPTAGASPHSRCQSPQPVPVPTASDLTHTQAAILRILRQRSYAWAPA